MAVGAQMKMAHNLMRADQILKRELERVLVTSLTATDFEVESDQIELMVAGIMKVCVSSVAVCYVICQII